MFRSRGASTSDARHRVCGNFGKIYWQGNQYGNFVSRHTTRDTLEQLKVQCRGIKVIEQASSEQAVLVAVNQ